MANETYRLIIKTGPTPGKAFELIKDVMSIGREANSDITIQDTEISRNHARISRKSGAYVLEDQGSTNGTFVNKQRLMAPRALVPGDEIGLGTNVVVTFQGEGAAATVVASTAYQSPGSTKQPAHSSPASAPQAAPVYVTQNAVPAKAGGPGKMIVGCLVAAVVVLCLAAIVGAVLIETMNLYCTPPFDMIGGMLKDCTIH
jgi:pSer/pThr/pTyr-binding forkhead associated (FHA) protein